MDFAFPVDHRSKIKENENRDLAFPVDHRSKIKENEKRDLAFPVDHRSKIKENKKIDYPKKLKLWNIKVTVILIINGVLGTVSKGLAKELDELEIGGVIEII